MRRRDDNARGESRGKRLPFSSREKKKGNEGKAKKGGAHSDAPARGRSLANGEITSSSRRGLSRGGMSLGRRKDDDLFRDGRGKVSPSLRLARRKKALTPGGGRQGPSSPHEKRGRTITLPIEEKLSRERERRLKKA